MNLDVIKLQLQLFVTVTAERGAHKVRVHPQFFGRMTHKFFEMFLHHDLNRVMHPQIFAPCAEPV